jgi:hypothetical protein
MTPKVVKKLICGSPEAVNLPKNSELIFKFNTPVPFKNIGFLFAVFAQNGGIALWFGVTQDKCPTQDGFRGIILIQMKILLALNQNQTHTIGLNLG